MSGRLFVLMHMGTYRTHKQGGTEVWVLDTKTRKLVKRIPLQPIPTSGLAYGQTAGFKGSPYDYSVPQPYFQINPALSGDIARIHRSDWSGKLALNYHITQDIMPYVSWNKGLKAGGFSTAGNPGLPINLFKFDEETLYTYEAGIKTEGFDHRVRFNADVFKYAYVGYQAFNTIGVNNFITNNPGKMRGGEAELTVVPVSGLTLRAGLALLDAWIRNIVLPDGTVADVRPTQAPKTASAASDRARRACR